MGNALTLLNHEKIPLFKAFENNAQALSLAAKTDICEGY